MATPKKNANSKGGTPPPLGPPAPKWKARRVSLVLAAIVVVAILAAGAFFFASKSARTSDPPDVILITIDTLRADALGYAGNQRVSTPISTVWPRAASSSRTPMRTTWSRCRPTPTSSPVSIPISTAFATTPASRSIRRIRPSRPCCKTAGYTTAAFVSAFPLDSPLRTQSRFRCVRRQVPRRARTRSISSFRNGRPKRRWPPRNAGTTARRTGRSSSGSTSTTRMRRTTRPAVSRAVPGRPVPRRSCVCRRAARAISGAASGEPSQHARRHHRRSWRSSRRSRRTDAWTVRLRVDAESPADHHRPRPGVPTRRPLRPAHRYRPDHPSRVGATSLRPFSGHRSFPARRERATATSRRSPRRSIAGGRRWSD